VRETAPDIHQLATLASGNTTTSHRYAPRSISLLLVELLNNAQSTRNMWFCPLDGTLLQVRNGEAYPINQFFCLTCPYSCNISEPRTIKTYPERKVVDDILGGAAAWENVDRTMAVCPACNYGEAYFMQMQIRSADEPMSIFYKCVKCSHQWNDK
jgi:DNA-directed RNA polymerase III subunit RPC11